MSAGELLIPLTLYALATVDSAFIGYREAAGRSALIRKGAYYRRALLRGALWGQAAVALAGACLLCVYAASDDREGLLRGLLEAGRRMLCVYVPYALVVTAAFAVRLAPSVDVKSLTSVLIFGPFLLARPFVVAAGVAWGVAVVNRADVTALGVLVLSEMLLLERFLLWLRARREKRINGDGQGRRD